MKKTHNINLNGQAFCIDEDAYIKLKNYLETLEKYYLTQEEGKEIISDIECRIAELLSESLQQTHRQVIIEANIDQVIDIMGTPSAIIDEEPEEKKSEKRIRKLYRDSDKQILGGVAAGIATYWNIPVIYIRISLIAFSFLYGITFLIYLILWIALPKAITARQKIEMKGDKINIFNIEKSIRDSYNNVNKGGKLQAFIQSIGNCFFRIFHTLWFYINRMFSMILSILAVGGIITGTVFILSVCYLLLFPTYVFGCYNIPALFQLIPATPFFLMKITLFIVLNIPALIITYGAICYLFKFNASRVFILSASGLWFIGCLLGFFVSIHQGLKFSNRAENSLNIPLELTKKTPKELYLRINDLPDKLNHPNLKISTGRHFFDMITLDSTQAPIVVQKVGITLTNNAETLIPELWIDKSARGTSHQEAIENMEQIDVKWLLSNDTLYLNNFFTTPQNYWRAQEVRIILSIPDGYTIHFLNIQPEMFRNPYIFQEDLRSYQHHQSFQMRDKRLIGDKQQQTQER